MADSRKLGFGPIAAPAGGVLVVFADDGVKLGPKTKRLLGSAADLVVRAAKNERFKKILENWRAFRAEQHRWFSIADTRAEIAVYSS